jgi:hypothetical protein
MIHSSVKQNTECLHIYFRAGAFFGALKAQQYHRPFEDEKEYCGGNDLTEFLADIDWELEKKY